MLGNRHQLMVRSLGSLTVIVVFLLPTIWSEKEGFLLGRVLVSKARIDSSQTLNHHKIPSGANPDIFCSLRHQFHLWSQLWCWDPSSEECFLSNAMVTAGYQETNMADALTCYTQRIKDIVTSAVDIYAGNRDPSASQNVKENLVDGFYNYGLQECFKSEDNILENHWIMIDFGIPKTFSHVMVKVKTTKGARYFHRVEVRVGNASVPFTWEGMEGHQLFDFFPGSATPSQEIHFEVPDPVTARFVSMRMLSFTSSFMPCHMEIY